MYLEDVLRLIGYQDSLQQKDKPVNVTAQKRHQTGDSASHVPKEQREVIESAIMQAFLHGSDEDFDHLLEVWTDAALAYQEALPFEVAHREPSSDESM
jgi:hypothetical protein